MKVSIDAAPDWAVSEASLRFATLLCPRVSVEELLRREEHVIPK